MVFLGFAKKATPEILEMDEGDNLSDETTEDKIRSWSGFEAWVRRVGLQFLVGGGCHQHCALRQMDQTKRSQGHTIEGIIPLTSSIFMLV